jgi:hypothetical protein
MHKLHCAVSSTSLLWRVSGGTLVLAQTQFLAVWRGFHASAVPLVHSMHGGCAASSPVIYRLVDLNALLAPCNVLLDILAKALLFGAVYAPLLP